jgi:hypothetical protein
MGELVKGIVEDVRESGKAYGFTLSSTGKYNTYTVFRGLKPKEGSEVEFERELYKPAEGDSPYNRWNIVKDTLKINQPAQQAAPQQGSPGKALKGEFRSPDEMKRSSALASAVNLMKDIQLGEDLDGIVRNVLYTAKHFTYFLSSGSIHNSLTPNNKEEPHE